MTFTGLKSRYVMVLLMLFPSVEGKKTKGNPRSGRREEREMRVGDLCPGQIFGLGNPGTKVAMTPFFLGRKVFTLTA